MMHRSIPGAARPAPDRSQRRVALAAAFSLLFMAVLAPFAQFGVLAMLVPGYALTISTFTFVGEALLIVWLFKLAIRGSRPAGGQRAVGESPVGASTAIAS